MSRLSCVDSRGAVDQHKDNSPVDLEIAEIVLRQLSEESRV